ncbi:hypothetical protein [Halomicronema hongdechloris]|nr:hypothetical protein [Halomicronema hongdechloris]
MAYSLIFDQALYIWVVQPSGNIEFRAIDWEASLWQCRFERQSPCGY